MSIRRGVFFAVTTAALGACDAEAGHLTLSAAPLLASSESDMVQLSELE